MDRAVIYCRVSTEEQAEEGVSLDMQRDVCIDYCRRVGLEVGQVYIDDGVSSTIPLEKRPSGSQLAAQVAMGETEAVVAYEGSRLWRDNLEGQGTARRWWTLGVTLHYVRGGGAQDLEDPESEFRFGLDAILSRREVRVLRRRIRDGMKSIVQREGRFIGGDVYGYRPLPERKGIEPDPEEAEIVKEIFKRWNAGASAMEIMHTLNLRGVLTKRGAQWSWYQVGAVLRNPVYIGMVRWAGEIHEGAHEPIISKRAWNKAQSRVDLRKRHGGRRLKHYTPLFRCGHCGSVCRCQPQKRTPKAYNGKAMAGKGIIDCNGRYKLPADVRHPGIATAEVKLMAVVWRHTELFLQRDDLDEAIADAQAAKIEHADLSDEIETELAALAADQDKLVVAYREGALDIDTLRRHTDPIRERQAALQAQVQAAEPPDIAGWAELRELGVGGMIATVREKASIEEHLDLLQTIYEHVAVTREALTFHYIGASLPPETRLVPAYYSEIKGCVDVGF